MSLRANSTSRGRYAIRMGLKSSTSGIDVLDRLVRHAEYLRQISSNRAFTNRRQSRTLNSITIALGSAVTFVAFIGISKIHQELAGVVSWPAGPMQLGFDILVLALVVASILALIFQFSEQAVRHQEAIRRLTQFIGHYGDLSRGAKAGEIEFSFEDAMKAREQYLMMVSPLPESTDREFFRAKKDYQEKRSKSLDQGGLASALAVASPNARLERQIRGNQALMRYLRVVSDAPSSQELWICGGAVRNVVWDSVSGFVRETPFDDVDVIYFDPSSTAKSGEIEIADALRGQVGGIVWDVRNQARQRIGTEHKPKSLRDAVQLFPETCSAVAVRLVGETIEVICPFGLDDLENMVVEPTSSGAVARATERLSDKDWLKKWPALVLDESLLASLTLQGSVIAAPLDAMT